MFIHEILGGLNLLLLYYCLTQTSALQASLLITIRPIFITIAGIILLKEKEERHEVIGLILATIGATLITAGPVIEARSIALNIAIIGILLTNIFDALLTVNFKKRLAPLPKQSVNIFHVIFALIFYSLININHIPSNYIPCSAISTCTV
jgi:drug/metabolite transporter (DMT)-like permease